MRVALSMWGGNMSTATMFDAHVKPVASLGHVGALGVGSPVPESGERSERSHSIILVQSRLTDRGLADALRAYTPTFIPELGSRALTDADTHVRTHQHTRAQPTSWER